MERGDTFTFSVPLGNWNGFVSLYPFSPGGVYESFGVLSVQKIADNLYIGKVMGNYTPTAISLNNTTVTVTISDVESFRGYADVRHY